MLPPPAITNPKTPIAFARSAGSVKRTTINENARAETTAPLIPWTARAAISIPWLVETPQLRLAALKKSSAGAGSAGFDHGR
jgi:hypothetical protein